VTTCLLQSSRKSLTSCERIIPAKTATACGRIRHRATGTNGLVAVGPFLPLGGGRPGAPCRRPAARRTGVRWSLAAARQPPRIAGAGTSLIRSCSIFDREAYYAMGRFFHRLGVGFLAGIFLCVAFIIFWYALAIIVQIPVIQRSLDDSFVGRAIGIYLWDIYIFCALSIPLGQIYSFCFFRRQWRRAIKKTLKPEVSGHKTS